MAKNKLNSGTTKGQRVAIWAILVLTVASTVGLYFSMFLNQKNQLADQKKQQENAENYQKAYTEYQEKLKKQADELSVKYYAEFSAQKSRVAAFSASDVEKDGVKTEDLKIGDGAEINDSSTEYTAYYLGWKPDGTIFDGSIDGEKLKNPFTVQKQGENWGVIEGWTEGVKGMKVGGIREVSIPSAKAYGATGSPNSQDPAKSIGANEALKFVIMLVPKPAEIPAPDPAQFNLGV